MKKILTLTLVFALFLIGCQSKNYVESNKNNIFFLSELDGKKGISLNAITDKTSPTGDLVTIKKYKTGYIEYNHEKVYISLPYTNINDSEYKSKIIVYDIKSGNTQEIEVDFYVYSTLSYKNNIIIFGEKSNKSHISIVDKNYNLIYEKDFDFKAKSLTILNDYIYFTNDNYKNKENGLKVWKFSLKDNEIKKEIFIGKNYENGHIVNDGNSVIVGCSNGKSGEVIEFDSELKKISNCKLEKQITDLAFGSKSLLINTVDNIKDITNFYLYNNGKLKQISNFNNKIIYNKVSYRKDTKQFIVSDRYNIYYISDNTGKIIENNIDKVIVSNLAFN